MSSTPTPTPEVLRMTPVEIRTPAGSQFAAGKYLLASIKAPTLGGAQFGLVLDMHSGELVLQAECGCSTHIDFRRFLGSALLQVAREHTAPEAGDEPAIGPVH